jgi:hypothetical protein
VAAFHEPPVAVTCHPGHHLVTPAIKWQISPMPGKFDLSATVGVGLPTGTTGIAGPGAQPYLQFPWSRELSVGWGLSGMVTLFFRPSDPISQLTTQATFVIEKRVGERADLFVEYVGCFSDHVGSCQLINTGGVYRLTPRSRSISMLASASTATPQTTSSA